MALGLAIIILIIGLVSAIATASGYWWLTPLASNWGSVDTMINATTIVTGIVFVVIHIFMAYMVYRFHVNRTKRAAYIEDSPVLERWLVVGTSVAIFLLLVPGLFVYAQVVGAPDEDPLIVDVYAEQWRWNFRFTGEDGELGNTDINLVDRENVLGIDVTDPNAADDVVIVGPEPLYLPVDRPVLFQFRSKDVLHAFWVPEFRLMIDAVPGMVTEQWLTPSRTGQFQAVCAEYCGVVHYGMLNDIIVVEQDEFDSWLAEQPKAVEMIKQQGGQ